MTFIVPSEREVAPRWLGRIGGKARALVQLQAKFAVPPFAILVLDDQDAEAERPATVWALAHGPRATFAVRSSANLEDSSSASFAGLFETRLSVPACRIGDAVREVVASAHSERVGEYCRAKSLDITQLTMAVVIQRMVDSRVAGVCLSRSPERPDYATVEAIYGLGELLVSGQVAPDRYFVRRDGQEVVVDAVGFQRLQLRPGSEGEPVIDVVPPLHRNARKLLSHEARAVGQLGVAVEAHLDVEAGDIEWAYEADDLYLLQGRPLVGGIG